MSVHNVDRKIASLCPSWHSLLFHAWRPVMHPCTLRRQNYSRIQHQTSLWECPGAIVYTVHVDLNQELALRETRALSMQNNWPWSQLESVRKHSPAKPSMGCFEKRQSNRHIDTNHVSQCGASTESLCKSHASGSLQDPWLRACYKIHVSGPSARFMSPGRVEDPCLRIHAFVSRGANPRQDAYLRTYASASLSVGPLQDPCLRIHYNIHGSKSSARSMSPDPL